MSVYRYCESLVSDSHVVACSLQRIKSHHACDHTLLAFACDEQDKQTVERTETVGQLEAGGNCDGFVSLARLDARTATGRPQASPGLPIVDALVTRGMAPD